jgi:hypothetical protein
LMVRYLPESPVARPVRDPIRERLQSRSRIGRRCGSGADLERPARRRTKR